MKFSSLRHFALTPALVLALALLLSACGQNNDQAAAIGVVDMNRLQSQSQLIQKATAHLEAVQQALLGEALKAEQAYQEDQTEENDMARQDALAGLQDSFGQAQQALFTELRSVMDRILETYRSEHGLSVILLKDTTLAMDPALDVTKDIMAAFDAMDLDMESLAPLPVSAPEPAALESTEEAAEAQPEAEAAQPESQPEPEQPEAAPAQ